MFALKTTATNHTSISKSTSAYHGSTSRQSTQTCHRNTIHISDHHSSGDECESVSSDDIEFITSTTASHTDINRRTQPPRKCQKLGSYIDHMVDELDRKTDDEN